MSSVAVVVEVVGRLLGGRPRSGRRRLPGQVLAGENALGERAPDDLRQAELLAGGDDLGLDDPPEHRVLRLVADQGDPELAGELRGGLDLLGPPLRDPDVERLSGADDVGEGDHGLLQRRLVVVAVGLVEVDVVGLQPREGQVDGLEDVLARQAPVVRAVADRPVDLGEDLETATAFALQGTAEHRLGAPGGIDVRGVEGRDAGVESGADAGDRGVLLDLGPVGHPVAVGDLADQQAGPAEVSMLHAAQPRKSGDAAQRRVSCRGADQKGWPIFTRGLGMRIRRICRLRITA